ncbi:hypothetical protein A2U01_0069345, partial [Trifolium medium]|nr:hypothetical protein [Trifolium medium]
MWRARISCLVDQGKAWLGLEKGEELVGEELEDSSNR